MPVRSNLTGRTFGKLTAIRTVGQDKPGGKFIWLCKCECGNERKVKVDNLTGGHTRSCGCLVGQYKRTPDQANLASRTATKKWKDSHRAKVKEYARGSAIRHHGLTTEQYDELFAKQGGVCAICKIPSRFTLQVDHDHKCCNKTHSCGRCVRGLLCSACNHALGRMKDRPELLRAAAKYLESFGAVETVRGAAEISPKIQSELHGDMQRAAEMTVPLLNN